MTNEEIAMQLQEKIPAPERTNLYAQLWEQNRGLIWQTARRFSACQEERCARCGVTTDDLAQSGFFALVGAVKAYRADSGYKLTTYLRYHLKTHFSAALNGGKRRTAKDLLNECDSLDKPTGEDGDCCLLDIIPDPDGGNLQEEAEESIFQEQLRQELAGILDGMEPECTRVIKRRYMAGRTLRAVGQELGKSMERVRQLEGKAMRQLRNPKNARRLRPFAEQVCCLAWRGTGYSTYRDTGVSSVERAVEKIDSAERRANAEGIRSSCV